MSDTLFDLPAEPRAYDPEPRTTTVRTHTRVVGARRTDPATSALAGATDRGPLEARIVAAFEEHGPMTSDEVCDVIRRTTPGTPEQSIKSAISRTRVVQSGRFGKTKLGRTCCIWVLP